MTETLADSVLAGLPSHGLIGASNALKRSAASSGS